MIVKSVILHAGDRLRFKAGTDSEYHARVVSITKLEDSKGKDTVVGVLMLREDTKKHMFMDVLSH